MRRVFEFIGQTGWPNGVLNLVNGASGAVDAIIGHPAVRAVSFVGSTAVARHVYARAAAAGKRAQCHGGQRTRSSSCRTATSRRPLASSPTDSAFGCAGRRCLAASLAIAVGDARAPFEEAIADAARSRVVGNGLDERVEMITPQTKARIERLIGSGLRDGGLSGLDPRSETASTEIFGPVLGIISVPAVEDAIALINSGRYGPACLRRTAPPRANSVRRPRSATLGSTSERLRRWRPSRSAAGRKASSATSTGRAATPSSVGRAVHEQIRARACRGPKM
jgi:malonate-semialdehyde dehydrogenase (acetylating)/methylmalonate-semialdehyde dehydrogenase